MGEEAQDLVPVVLAALDRVAMKQEPESFGVFCTTDSWWLLDRLRRLGFRVHWPSWVMCSVPLPGLDRYVPTRPPRLLVVGRPATNLTPWASSPAMPVASSSRRAVLLVAGYVLFKVVLGFVTGRCGS